MGIVKLRQQIFYIIGKQKRIYNFVILFRIDILCNMCLLCLSFVLWFNNKKSNLYISLYEYDKTFIIKILII